MPIMLSLSLFWLLWLPFTMAWAAQPDWNESQIQWYGYHAGMKEAERTGKPVVLIFYAQWCPTCHAYKRIFAQSAIVDLAQQLIMIRVDIDEEPELSARYNFDGDYVPRTFVVSSDTQVHHDIYAKKRYRYFIKASDFSTFELLMRKAVAFSKKD